MARSSKATSKATAKADSTANGSANSTGDREKAEARLGAASRILRQFGEVALAGAALGGKAAVLSLRGSMPMLELYSGTTRGIEQDSSDDREKGGLVKLGLSRGEAGVVRKAFRKGMLESIEISSITHPIYEGAPVYRIHNPEGGFEPPHMVHLLALGAAASAIWRDWGKTDEPPEPEPVALPAASQTVAYVAVRPGEYQYVAAPLSPSEIRRYAMRQRRLNPPQLAMLAYSGEPDSIVGARSSPFAARRSPSSLAHASSHAEIRAAPKRGGGCGCGSEPSPCRAGHSCGCNSGAPCSCHADSGAVARHDEDGNCANLLDISCETRWRIRECFKVSFCDLLRCMGDELCEKEEPDVGDCLEDFLCTLLNCLPDAICPPPERCEPCCPQKTIASCHCNFAVGE